MVKIHYVIKHIKVQSENPLAINSVVYPKIKESRTILRKISKLD